MYIDAHSHWSDERVLDVDVPGLLEKSRLKGISQFMLGGVGPVEWKRQIKLIENFPHTFYPCFGLHPYFLARHAPHECERALDELAFLLGRATALGETGLDFRKEILQADGENFSEEIRAVQIAKQIEFFENQIELAKVFSKPLVLHVVHAHEKALEIFNLWDPPARGGMVHAFNGSPEIALRYLNLNLHLSIGGAVTYDKNHKLHRAVEFLPLDRLLIESDSPDQAPQGWTGPNDSSSLRQIAERIGEIKKMDAATILETTTANFKMLFTP